MLAATTVQVTGRFELHQDLLQKLDRQVFFGREFVDLKKWLTECLCQPEIDQRPEGILAPLRKFHEILYYNAANGKTTFGTYSRSQKLRAALYSCK